MYYADKIGLFKLLYDTDEINNTPLNLDYANDMGRWEFTIRKCVDRRSEPYGLLDCTSANNQFALTFELIDSCTWSPISLSSH